MLGHANGRIAHVETQQTDLYIDKMGSMLMMSLRYKRDGYVDSMTNLKDPDELPLEYSRTITTSLAYPEKPKRLLMIGLGAGSISTYLGRHMPDLAIDALRSMPGSLPLPRPISASERPTKSASSRMMVGFISCATTAPTTSP